VFTFLSIQETTAQIQVSVQGQITDRYNAAITNLGSSSIDVRLGGIYALQRIMQDSPRDQPSVVAVLCAFVRDHASNVVGTPGSIPAHPRTDIQAALTVVGSRDAAHDGTSTVIDLSSTALVGASFARLNFSTADFSDADLENANFFLANIQATIFIGARLVDADISGVNGDGALVGDADLTGAVAGGASFPSAAFTRSDLTNADFSGADLRGANLSEANLTNTDFAGADLSGVIRNERGP